MRIQEFVAGRFDGDVRDRGHRYFLNRAVHIDAYDKDWLDATVKGTRPYTVSLDISAGDLEVSCTCPYFRGGDPCKHIWATILASDTYGCLQYGGAPEKGINVVLVPAESGAEVPHSDGPDFRDLGRLLLHPYGKERGLAKSFEEDADDALDRPGAGGATGIYGRMPRTGWKAFLEDVKEAELIEDGRKAESFKSGGMEVAYLVDTDGAMIGDDIYVSTASRKRRKDGTWGKIKTRGFSSWEVAGFPVQVDREIVAILNGGGRTDGYGIVADYGRRSESRYTMGAELANMILPKMCATGRCYARYGNIDLDGPLTYDDGPGWELVVCIRKDDRKSHYVVEGVVRRGDETHKLTEDYVVIGGRWVLHKNVLARLDAGQGAAWIGSLSAGDEIRIPARDAGDFVKQMLGCAGLPRIELPEELKYEEVHLVPVPVLRLKSQKEAWHGGVLRGRLLFDYGGSVVNYAEQGAAIYNKEGRRAVMRDRVLEQAVYGRLLEEGLKTAADGREAKGAFDVDARLIPVLARKLVADKWRIEADGKLYRAPGKCAMRISSGIDWFELQGDFDFGGTTVELPAVLRAIKRGETTVVLDDGTVGVLPEEWLNKYGFLVEMGTQAGEGVRFRRSQAGILDALLASEPETTCDDVFEKIHRGLQRFEKIEAVTEPAGFTGILREYQKEGLGWMLFLQQFGFGGCLADDMGLGKTVQALALLEMRRELREKAGGDKDKMIPPSLIVVPKTLIFNWKAEAARFAPRLKILDHTGTGRTADDLSHFEQYDVILTTYGTLRNDAIVFKDVEFDYVILDEAQNVKNADSVSAKASRLLKARHRLAMSGTPVENHLGELWSLLEFLNPGMFGAASTFRRNLPGIGVDEGSRALLARTVRPFILRRTKGQVAKELPDKTEETIFCEMDSAQRKLYDEVREYYRASLLQQVGRDGMAKSKMHVLEALLRLRQIACHPGLVDKSRAKGSSAKLDVLMSELEEVLAEGHKALVFSQFTSLLAIVRERLDAQGIVYEYLDGKTQNRGEHVNRFQTDPRYGVFLISLKAGGLGLNLTAAEYVFLLDPWWNPAVEAQAIDRTHRTGQTRSVFAYRIIAKGSVEEKVIELQKSKRELADAIIGENNSVIRNMTREDLEVLLT